MAHTSLSKITRPQLSGAVQRTRLFKILDTARKKPIVWISAPAGSGKTTLAASYLDARALPCLWYQVDEGDADIATFFYYMGLAAKKAKPGYKKPLPLLTPEHMPSVPSFTRRYFEQLCARLLPKTATSQGKPSPQSPASGESAARGAKPSERKKLSSIPAIVLDNYQGVSENSPFHDMLVQGLDALPQGVNVIIISRTAPPAPFARLLANGKIHMIGWEDIRFDLEETGALVKSRETADNTVSLLHVSTDGWAAGIVLMLESALKTHSGHASPQTGNIFNYFASEVFRNSEKETQEFLLKTAFFPTVTADMAERLTGIAHSGRILARLHTGNYFTQRQSGATPAYRYHPLLREFLLSRAQEIYTRQELEQIRQNAARILSETGDAEEAVRLFHAAGDNENLVKLILTQAPALASGGRFATLAQWLGLIPQSILEANPWCLYWLGICRMPFSPPESRSCFEKAFDLFKAGDDVPGLFVASSGMMDSYLLSWDDFRPLDRWVDEVNGLLARYGSFPVEEIERQLTQTMFSALLYRNPNYSLIASWEERLVQLMQKTDNPNYKLHCGYPLLQYYLWRGDTAKADALVAYLQPLADSLGNATLMRICWLVLRSVYDWTTARDFDACENAVEYGLQLADESGIHMMDSKLLAQAIYSRLLRDDVADVDGLLEKMRQTTNMVASADASHYHYVASYVAICRNDVQSALQHAEACVNFIEKHGFAIPQAMGRTRLAYVLFLNGAPYQKIALQLEEALKTGHRMKSYWIEANCFMLRGLFLLTAGKEAQGLEALSAGMAICAKHDVVTYEGWRRTDMAYIFARALEAGIEPEYAQNVIRKFKLTPPDATTISHLEHWPYPVKIYTLGKFRIVKDGKPLAFSGKTPKKPLELLKTIIALDGKSSKEKLADALWPDADGDKQQSAFTTTLARLRELLGSEQAVVMQQGKASLNPSLVWVDTLAFDASCKDADGYEKALVLYGGPFLHDDAGEHWTHFLRENLKTKFLHLVNKAGDNFERAGDWNKAKECYEQAITADNHTEEFYQRLMLCHKKLGHHPEAVRIYNRCRIALAAMGAKPSMKTEEIYSGVRE